MWRLADDVQLPVGVECHMVFYQTLHEVIQPIKCHGVCKMLIVNTYNDVSIYVDIVNLQILNSQYYLIVINANHNVVIQSFSSS